MEVEPRIAKQYKCQYCCSCKIYRGKGMEGGGKKVSLRRFLADQKIASSWKEKEKKKKKKEKKRFGGSYWAVQWSWFARVNALCNLSCKKSREVAASLPGRSLNRRCFTVCIIVEVEPRITKQSKCHYCCRCKNYRGKGMEGGKKVSLAVLFLFFCWPQDRESVGKMRFGPSYSTSNKLLLVDRHILTTGFQNCL